MAWSTGLGVPSSGSDLLGDSELAKLPLWHCLTGYKCGCWMAQPLRSPLARRPVGEVQSHSVLGKLKSLELELQVSRLCWGIEPDLGHGLGGTLDLSFADGLSSPTCHPPLSRWSFTILWRL